MRRWWIAVAVMTTATMGLVGTGEQVQAKSPGPNGQIAFSRTIPGGSDEDTVSYTMNPDGSHIRRLLPGFSSFPRWSPDGRLVSVGAPCKNGQENCALTLVDPDTGSVRQFTWPDPTLETDCGGAWSPDGRRLTCEGFGVTDPSRNGIYTIRASDGRGLRRITSNPGGDDIPGDFSPDGTQIVFLRTDPARPASADQALFVCNVDGSSLHRITPWSGNDPTERAGHWSPDGTTILFGSQFNIYLVRADGTGLVQVPIRVTGSSIAFSLGWSPDGTRIIFGLAGATVPEGIYTVRPDGTDLQAITSSPTFDTDPDWGSHPLAG
jgi:Tol biopolymer transport system component